MGQIDMTMPAPPPANDFRWTGPVGPDGRSVEVRRRYIRELLSLATLQGQEQGQRLVTTVSCQGKIGGKFRAEHIRGHGPFIGMGTWTRSACDTVEAEMDTLDTFIHDCQEEGDLQAVRFECSAPDGLGSLFKVGVNVTVTFDAPREMPAYERSKEALRNEADVSKRAMSYGETLVSSASKQTETLLDYYKSALAREAEARVRAENRADAADKERIAAENRAIAAEKKLAEVTTQSPIHKIVDKFTDGQGGSSLAVAVLSTLLGMIEKRGFDGSSKDLVATFERVFNTLVPMAPIPQIEEVKQEATDGKA